MSNVNNTMVITIFGKTINKKSCILIAGEYYEKNVDCFNIDGRWYRKGNPRIYFDDILGEWRKITPFVVEGITDYDKDTETYKCGKFEKTFEGDYYIETQYGKIVVCSKELFNRIPKIFDKGNGCFYDKKRAYSVAFNEGISKHGNAYIYSFDRLYNSESLIDIFSKVDNSKYIDKLITPDFKSSVINKYTFGFEIETSAGIIPEYKCKELGLIPLRDGSISGHEYTTIPMRGMDGVNLLANQMRELKNSCLINKDCSVHLHLGGFPLDESKILSLYNLCYNLQDEIGTLFPYYIYRSGSYKSNGKDYCKQLPQEMSSIRMLYEYLAEGNASWSGDFNRPHPNDPRRDRKWEVHSRYFYVNFINMLFGDKVKTVEFRVHNATTNIDKLVNWLYICMAILNYAENHVTVSGVSLMDVISYSYDSSVSDILSSYIDKRKDYNRMCLKKYNDTYGYFDLMEDKEMSFKTPVN